MMVLKSVFCLICAVLVLKLRTFSPLGRLHRGREQRFRDRLASDMRPGQSVEREE